eukprot:TCONS_00013764-protein
MSSIHYKFRSSLEYDTITFDGQAVSLSELREAIMKQKKIAQSPNYTLEIINAQTKEVYNTDESMVQKNSSVVVRRVPVQRLEDVTDGLTKEEAELTEMALAKLSTTANLADAKASEDDKIKAVMMQQGSGFDHTSYQKSIKAPPSYVCYRCGGKGHFVRQCPTQGDPRYNKQQFARAPSGIPREYYMMKMKQEQEILDSYRSIQGNTNFTPTVSSEIVDQTKVPSDLQCSLCKQLFKDAVVTPCCGVSYCDECIRTYLVENDLVCMCGETTSPDNLIGNKSLRTSVSNFRNQKPTEMKSTVQQSMNANTALQSQANSQSNGPLNTIKDEPVDSPVPPSELSNDATNGTAHMNVPSPAVATEAAGSITDSPKHSVKVEQPTVEQSALTVAASTALPTASVGHTATSVPMQSLPASAHHIFSTAAHFRGTAGPAIYSNVQGTARPGFAPVIAAQPTIVQQAPRIVQLPFQPGAQFVRQRLVPVAAPRFITAAPGLNQIHIAQPPTINTVNTLQQPGVDLSTLNRPIYNQPPQHAAQQAHSNAMKQSAAAAAAAAHKQNLLSEEDFYKWKMQLKNRPVRHRSRSRSPRSPNDKRGRRRRYRSISPSDGSKKRYDSPADDSSQERKSSSKRKKDKMKRRHRDSSQDSQPDTSVKQRSRGTLADKKRRIPDRIKREVDEFEFDNEMEFDEELRKLGKETTQQQTQQEARDSVTPTPDDDDTQQQVDVDDEKSPEPNQAPAENALALEGAEAEEQIETDENTPPLEHQNGAGEDVKEEKSNGESVEKGEEKVEKEGTEENEKTVPKPKRKTKIVVKKKVTRVIKRKRDGQIISETITRNAGEANEKTESVLKKESPSVKKVRLEGSEKTLVKRTVGNAKVVVKMTPDKKKELHKKRMADKSAAKAKQLLAEVQAKKEAEKKQLLEKVNEAKDTKSVKDVKDSKEERKRKMEKYLLLKKKAKEKAILERRKSAASAKSAEESDKTESVHNRSKEKIDKKSLLSDKERKRPDQNFYKLGGDSKLKTISDASKKQLKENEERHSSSSDVRSKVNVAKDRRKRGGVSDDESDSGDDRTSRRVVKETSSRSTRKVPESRRSRERERGESREHEKDRERERRRKEEEENRRREKEYERELREKKRMYKLQKEKEEMVERERQALKDKERLERKLEKERQIRKDMEREKYEDEQRQIRKREDDRRDKRRYTTTTTSERDTEEDSRSHRSSTSKKNKTGYVIQILDSEKERSGESSSEASEHQVEKKRKKKSKKKKDKKKKKKREQEDSDESEADSSDDEEETKSKKKKRKHKSRKHKKHSKKSKKHKKKSKKKKKKQEKDQDESDQEEEEANEGEDEEEGEDSGSESKDKKGEKESSNEDDGSDSGDSKDGSDEEASSSNNSSPARKEENEKGDGKEEESSSSEEKEVEQDDSEKVSKKKKDSLSPSKNETDKTESKSVGQKKKNEKPDDSGKDKDKPTKTVVPEKVKRKRSSIGDEDLELDYNDDVTANDEIDDVTEDALLYGDLGFADDEQANPDLTSGKESPSKKSDDECEEGEIVDDDLFTTTATTKTKDTEETSDETTTEKLSENPTTNENETSTIFDEVDTEIDDAIENAMIGLDDECDTPVDQSEAEAETER